MTNPMTEAELVQGHGGRVSVTYDVEVYAHSRDKWVVFWSDRTEENARTALEQCTLERKRLVRVTLEMKREVVE